MTHRHLVAIEIWRTLEDLRRRGIAEGKSDEDARRWAIGVCESMRRYTVKRRPIRTALDRALAEHGKAEAA